jgi:hypothetical protein
MPDRRLVGGSGDRDRGPGDEAAQSVRALRFATTLGGQSVSLGLGRALLREVQGLQEVIAVHDDLLWLPAE